MDPMQKGLKALFKKMFKGLQESEQEAVMDELQKLKDTSTKKEEPVRHSRNLDEPTTGAGDGWR